MTLLGRASWYLPRWLEWLPQVRLDEAPALDDAEPAPSDDADVAARPTDPREA